MTQMPTKSRPVRLLAIAAIAGLAVGLAGVYVTKWSPVHSAGGCEASQQALDAIKSSAHGQLAGLIPAESPADLSTLAFQTADGKPTGIAELKGRFVLLNLWATWCVPCRKEMPALDRLAAARNGPDFTVATVNMDVGDPAKPRTFLDEIKVAALPDYRDPKMALFTSLKTRGLAFGLPTSLILDRKGCQIGALNGPAEWDDQAVLDLVDRLVAIH